jgi:frataxin-like iron-binding protein CyaY
VLKKGGGINKYSEIGLTDHAMNAQMAQLRKFDNDSAKQSGLADLEPVGGDHIIASVDDVIRIVRNTAPHVAVFWTATHTMGYRYAHNEKEFFDNEVGLYRAKTSKEIKAKLNQIIAGYGGVTGVRVVKLKT